MKKIISLLVIATSFLGYNLTLKAQTIGWQQLNFVPTYPLYGVYCINYDTVVAVGVNGYIIRTTNGGANWTQIVSNTTNTLYKVQFVNDTTGYVVGENGTILKTTDIGQSWANIGISTNLNLISLSFINKDTGWVAGGIGDLYAPLGNKGILLKTIDGGINWIVDSTYDKTISSVSFVNNDTGYICTNNFPLSILKKTINNGNSFVTVRYDSLLAHYYTDVQFIDNRIGYFVSSAPGDDKNGVFKTTDYGVTWSKVLTQWSIKSLEVIDSCSFYCSWSDMPGDGSIGKNTCISDSFNGPGHRIFDFSFINLDSGFAVGNLGCYNNCNGVIYKRGLLANINKKKKQKIEIYPNPFNYVINIDLNSNIEIYKFNINIYNSLGNIISGITKLQNNKIIIDLKNEPNGLYYLIIKDNNKIIRTEKLIKIKSN